MPRQFCDYIHVISAPSFGEFISCFQAAEENEALRREKKKLEQALDESRVHAQELQQALEYVKTRAAELHAENNRLSREASDKQVCAPKMFPFLSPHDDALSARPSLPHGW